MGRLFGCGDHGSPSCFLLAGLPRRLPCHLVLFTQPLFLLPHLRIETLLLSLWLFSVFRVYSQVFFDRTAVFSAEAVRDSTRTTYDSILECFFVWCARFSD